MVQAIRHQPWHLWLQAVAFCALLLSGTTAFAATEARVVYVDGSVTRTDGRETPLDIGDAVPLDATVRVSPSSFIELSVPNGRIFLSEPGQYALAPLAARAGNPAIRAASGAVRGLVRSLGRDTAAPRTSVAAGVRGEESPGAAATRPVWETGDIAGDLVDEALAYREDGLYDLALDTLTDARDLGADEATVRFHEAGILFHSGDPRRALEVLSVEQPGQRHELWEAHLLLQAEISYELSMHSSVHAMLEPLLEDEGTLSDSARTSAMLLLALSYHAYGRPRKAAYYLDRLARDTSPADPELAELVTALRSAW